MLLGSWSNVLPISCAAPSRVAPTRKISMIALTHGHFTRASPAAPTATPSGAANASAL